MDRRTMNEAMKQEHLPVNDHFLAFQTVNVLKVAFLMEKDENIQMRSQKEADHRTVLTVDVRPFTLDLKHTLD